MLKKIIILLLAVASFSCVTRRPELIPAAGPCFRSLTMKFSFRDGETRQNGRILWRFDAGSSKFNFFNALNQSGLELDVAGEDAVLVNFSRKSYWQGDFAGLLEKLWGIGLTLSELKSLLLSEAAPPAEFVARGITVLMERPGASGAPEAVRLRRGSAELVLRVLKNDVRPGRIVLVDYAGRYHAAELEDVLEP